MPIFQTFFLFVCVLISETVPLLNEENSEKYYPALGFEFSASIIVSLRMLRGAARIFLHLQKHRVALRLTASHSFFVFPVFLKTTGINMHIFLLYLSIL